MEQFGSARKHWSNANNASLCAEIEGAEWVEYHSMLELAPAYTSRTAVSISVDYKLRHYKYSLCFSAQHRLFCIAHGQAVS